MHPLQVEVRTHMPVLKIVLTPQPAVARARSGVAATSSESTIKSQFWFESASVVSILTFSRQLANILVALLTPAALVAFVLGLWRVCADLGWAGAFLVDRRFLLPLAGMDRACPLV